MLHVSQQKRKRKTTLNLLLLRFHSMITHIQFISILVVAAAAVAFNISALYLSFYSSSFVLRCFLQRAHVNVNVFLQLSRCSLFFYFFVFCCCCYCNPMPDAKNTQLIWCDHFFIALVSGTCQYKTIGWQNNKKIIIVIIISQPFFFFFQWTD